MQVELLSPTSVRMKNSVLVRNAHNFETYLRNLQKLKNQTKSKLHMYTEKSTEKAHELDESILKNDYLAAQKRPAARDGHSCHVLTEGSKAYMLLFGGDRH